MPIAICLKCGAKKFGALTLCPDCHFTLHDETDKAKSMLLSSLYLSPAELDAKAELIHNGDSVTFSDDGLAAVLSAIPLSEIDVNVTPHFRPPIILTAFVTAAVLVLIHVDNLFVKALAAGLIIRENPRLCRGTGRV